jgi:uncharacterized protein YijF (DUF1287 family)
MVLLLVVNALLSGQTEEEGFGQKLAGAALLLTRQEVVYDPSYYSMDYPGGDVPADRGVCTDVVIRAYRMLDVDLQKEVHEDMKAHFESYPQLWGLQTPDPNIDHRRVPNLMRFLSGTAGKKKSPAKPGIIFPGILFAGTWEELSPTSE